jgi:hypothetical protein
MNMSAAASMGAYPNPVGAVLIIAVGWKIMHDDPQVNRCCDAHVVASMMDLMRADDSMTLCCIK